MSDYRTLVVPYDFSRARAALSTAMDLARRLGADLYLIHVIEPPSYTYGYGAHADGVVDPRVDMRNVNEGATKALREVVDKHRGDSSSREPTIPPTQSWTSGHAS